MALKVRASKERLDRLLAVRGLATSREAAGRMILAGSITVDGTQVDKPAKLVPLDACIEVLARGASYVSRAGEKLAAALDAFQIHSEGLIGLDVGCSTGGFTDCLLQRGAKRIYAVDVGYGQFDWRLRHDPRVVLLERTNVRFLAPSSIPDPIDVAVVDVSFISLTIVLPCLVKFLGASATVVVLVKPQFEVGRGKVGKGGVVRDDAQRQAVTEKIIQCGASLGFEPIGVVDSPVEGRKGNREILVAFERGKPPCVAGCRRGLRSSDRSPAWPFG